MGKEILMQLNVYFDRYFHNYFLYLRVPKLKLLGNKQNNFKNILKYAINEVFCKYPHLQLYYNSI